MTIHRTFVTLLSITACVALVVGTARLSQTLGQVRDKDKSGHPGAVSEIDRNIEQNARRMVEEGRRTFRYDTFGSEAFWGDALGLHKAIAGEKLGGVGAGLSPKKALEAGLKVDADALPKKLVGAIKAGKVNMDDPATTLELLKINSVVGITGLFTGDGKLRSIRHPVRVLPFNCQRLILARHRSQVGRMAESRSQCRSRRRNVPEPEAGRRAPGRR